MKQSANVKKPRVLIDARMVGATGHGISLYVAQLAEGLARLDLPYEPFYLLHNTCPQDSFLRKLPHVETNLKFLEPAELVGLPAEIRKVNAALYHSPSFSSLLVYPCPHVQTVHDLNHLHFGSLVQKIYYRTLLLRSLRKAKRALSVSECAAMEIRSWLLNHGIDRKIGVAANSIAPFPEQNDPEILRKIGVEPGQFFFALGNAKPHKNLAMLARAFAAARARNEKLPPLVLSVGGESGKGLVYTGPLTNAAVGALLRNAKAVFSPSLYEGFGRPPVEAALAGTVPVASAIAVHHEVLDGVSEAIFVEPKNESAWADQFLAMADFSGRVSPASQAWILKRFSVEALAANMDRVYRECLGL